MFIWPDGQITGAEHWEVLAQLVGEKPKESDHYPAGAPTKAGWDRLEAHLTEHLQAVTPPQPEETEPEESRVNADQAGEETAPPKRGPGRPRKES